MPPVRYVFVVGTTTKKGMASMPLWARLAGIAHGSQQELLSSIGKDRFEAAVEPARVRTTPFDGPGTNRRRRWRFTLSTTISLRHLR